MESLIGWSQLFLIIAVPESHPLLKLFLSLTSFLVLLLPLQPPVFGGLDLPDYTKEMSLSPNFSRAGIPGIFLQVQCRRCGVGGGGRCGQQKPD